MTNSKEPVMTQQNITESIDANQKPKRTYTKRNKDAESETDGKNQQDSDIEKTEVDSNLLLKPKFTIQVKNLGSQNIFEPVTRTTIGSGKELTIECLNATFKQRALANLRQLRDLGKQLEISDD